jgi:hypothetical protein
MNPIALKFIEDRITYTGKELKSGWISEHTGLSGDAMVSFVGPADVPVENMVDLEDVERNAPILSPLMLHFIIEHFGISLENAVLRQRLLMAIIVDELKVYPKLDVMERKGDDIYEGGRKLSVSIAAPSPRSCCIHSALNIECEGTPVPTVGLSEYGIDPIEFGKRVMRGYCEELSQVDYSCTKVRNIP